MRKWMHRIVPSISASDIDAISGVLESGRLVRDSHVRNFEHAMAAYVGREYAVSTTSGFAALHLALLTLGIGSGDDVAIPSYTCHALFHAVRCTGAVPIVFDSDYENMSLSMESYKKAVSRHTKAVIVPHTFGFPVDIEAFRVDGRAVIEDAACALGGRFRGKALGSFGDVSIFSFSATKIITTGGEGGMVLMDDPKLAIRARLTGDYKETDAPPEGPCYCYRMTEMQAAMGISQLRDFDQAYGQRATLHHRYTERLEGEQWDGGDGTLPSFYTYALRLPSNHVRKVTTHMAEREIECLPAGYTGIHRLLGMDDQDFPGATHLLDSVLLLPLHPGMSIGDVDYVCESLEEVM